MSYRTHDLRRGHARDLQLSGTGTSFSLFVVSLMYDVVGAPLYEILQAGEWRSPAFLKYLDMETFERDLVIQAHLNEESEDGDS